MDIKHYIDYRQYLNDKIDSEKKRRPNLSVSNLSKRLGLGDPSSLNKVLRGQRHPGPKMLKSLCSWLDLPKQEEEYFVDLINLSKASKSSYERIYIFERLKKKSPKREFRDLNFDEYQVISKWYFLAIRELVKDPNFQENSKWIQDRLLLPVTRIEIELAINILCSLKLLIRDENGNLKQGCLNFHSPHEVASNAIRVFHEKNASRTGFYLKHVDLEKRHFLSSTFGIKKEHLGLFKKKLDELYDEFVSMAEDEQPDEIYQLNIQFVPLTKVQDKDTTK